MPIPETTSLKLAMPAALNDRLELAIARLAAGGRDVTKAEVVRRALRYRYRRPGVALPRISDVATRAERLVLTINDIPATHLPTAPERVVDVLAWYLDRQMPPEPVPMVLDDPNAPPSRAALAARRRRLRAREARV